MKPDYIVLAEKEIGVKEFQGSADNPRVVEYHMATTLKSTEDETPWCSAFMNWVLMKTNYERTYSAAARSWLQVGKRLDAFEPYCIVVLKRGTSSWQGHVAFAIADLGSHIKCLGGNQKDSVCYSNYAKTDVLAFIRPTRLIENRLA